jgi:hypothetical protein
MSMKVNFHWLVHLVRILFIRYFNRKAGKIEPSLDGLRKRFVLLFADDVMNHLSEDPGKKDSRYGRHFIVYPERLRRGFICAHQNTGTTCAAVRVLMEPGTVLPVGKHTSGKPNTNPAKSDAYRMDPVSYTAHAHARVEVGMNIHRLQHTHALSLSSRPSVLSV